MDERRRVWLHSRGTEGRVECVARPATMGDLPLWTRWHEHMGADAEDRHWDWDVRIARSSVGLREFLVLSLEGAGELQGLMELELSTGLASRYGLHVNRLSTGPWNRPPENRHRGAGSILMAAAVLESLRRGHEGRIYLEALPGAVRYYAGIGMMPCEDCSGEGLPGFRFDPDAAWAFVLDQHSRGHIDVDAR